MRLPVIVRRLVLPSLLVLGLVGCPESAPPADPPAAPAADAPTPAAPAAPAEDYGDEPAEHMRHHFADATVIQEAVVRADLEAMRAAAGSLAGHAPLEGLGDDAKPAIAAVRAAATSAKDAPTLADAAKALGSLGAACGSCHASRSITPTFAAVPKPSEDPSLQGHMARHAWAVNRAWEGLVAGDAAGWTKGLNGLAEPPLAPEAFGPNPPEAATTASQTVHELAVTGLSAEDPAARGGLYGDLLAACSTCHEALGRAPGKGVYTGEQ